MTTPTPRSSTPPTSPDTPLSGPAGTSARRRLARVGSIIGAALLAWVVLLLATVGVGIDVVAPGPTGMAPVTGPAVLVATLVAGLTGWGLLALLERFAPRHGRTIWTVAAVAVALVSVALGPTAATTAAGGTVLAALHLLVAGCMIVGFRLAGRA